MQVGETIKFKLRLFKKLYKYECGEHGIVLERLGGGLSLYVTDASHEAIYCAAPLGSDKDFKDVSLYLYSVDGNRMFFRIRRAVLYIDFENKWCATNVENFRVFGSSEWGQNCLVPWKDEYTKLYNAAEIKRTGKDA